MGLGNHRYDGCGLDGLMIMLYVLSTALTVTAFVVVCLYYK